MKLIFIRKFIFILTIITSTFSYAVDEIDLIKTSEIINKLYLKADSQCVTEKCFDAAKKVGEILANESQLPSSSIKYRVVVTAEYNSDMALIEESTSMPLTHMVVVAEINGKSIVFDTAMHQFKRVDEPFIGEESKWLKLLKKTFASEGFPSKKNAAFYRDFNHFEGAKGC